MPFIKKFLQKSGLAIAGLVILLNLFPLGAAAFDDATIFYPSTKILSVSGKCASREVLILIYYSGTDTIWGSSNPACANGRYNYQERLTNWKISDGEFEVEIFDGGYKEKERQGAQSAPKREKIIMAGSVEAKIPEAENFEVLPISSQAQAAEAPSAAVSTEAAPTTYSNSLITPAESAAAEKKISNNPFFNDAAQRIFNILAYMKETAKSAANLIVKTAQTVILAAEKVFARVLAIAPDGKIILPEGENQISGRGIILAGASEAFIENTQVLNGSKIFITALSATDAPLAVAEKISGKGFKVGMSRASDKDIAFDWLMIESYDIKNNAAMMREFDILNGAASSTAETASSTPNTAPSNMEAAEIAAPVGNSSNPAFQSAPQNAGNANSASQPAPSQASAPQSPPAPLLPVSASSTPAMPTAASSTPAMPVTASSTPELPVSEPPALVPELPTAASSTPASSAPATSTAEPVPPAEEVAIIIEEPVPPAPPAEENVSIIIEETATSTLE